MGSGKQDMSRFVMDTRVETGFPWKAGCAMERGHKHRANARRTAEDGREKGWLKDGKGQPENQHDAGKRQVLRGNLFKQSKALRAQ